MMDRFQSTFTHSINELKEKVKARVPIEPVKEDYPKTEDYGEALEKFEKEMEKFKDCLNVVKQLLANLEEFMNESLDQITSFYVDRWNEIQEGHREEAVEKMKKFNEKLRVTYEKILKEAESQMQSSEDHKKVSFYLLCCK